MYFLPSSAKVIELSRSSERFVITFVFRGAFSHLLNTGTTLPMSLVPKGTWIGQSQISVPFTIPFNGLYMIGSTAVTTVRLDNFEHPMRLQTYIH